jgi:asparagine synthase (glutamine-hydrolysing)
VHADGPAGLGIQRLAVIDLDSGDQPVFTEDRRVVVVLNGEIYNFRDLRKNLESRGYAFQTNSDTEAIVHGYRAWGLDVLDHLNGMFGLAIWDDAKKILVLARDRMGIKPLYYSLDERGIVFGSEIRPILIARAARPTPDPVALGVFLEYRYTPSPLTAFRGVRKLAPGTRLVVRDGAATVERWWRYRPVPFEPMPTFAQAADDLLELYKQAVKRQLTSDVPLGLLLSGGVDSALLLALMNLYGREWKSFTTGFGPSYPEGEIAYAAQTAKLMGSPNYRVELDRDTCERSMPAIIRALEEPVARASVVPMYHVCRRASEDVKVILVGQGPDELFGGYKRHIGVRYGAHWRALPAAVRATVLSALSAIPGNEKTRRVLRSLEVPFRAERYRRIFSVVPGETVARLFKPGLLPEGASEEILDCWADLDPMMEGADELGGFQFLEVRSSLPDEFLMYEDKLSMAHGLEARLPYLDQEVVEYVERLAASYKVHWGRGKYIHRRVARNFLPATIMERRALAVEAPVDQWLRSSVESRMQTTLLDNRLPIYEYLRPEEVRRLVDDHRSGRRNNHEILYSLVVLNGWAESLLA